MSVIAKRKMVGFPTAAVTDPAQAAHYRDDLLPETAFPGPYTVVLDLQGKLFSPASLREMVVPLGQRLRGGVYGDLKIVIVSSDPATREMIALWAREYELAFFLADSADADGIDEATPVGDLTATDLETLEAARRLGGFTTVSDLATVVGLVPTAATNRLVNLEKKGYVFRLHRGARQGDIFVDPRAQQHAVVDSRPPARPMRAALRDAGIEFDPYAAETVRLEGAAAERAEQILERRSEQAE